MLRKDYDIAPGSITILASKKNFNLIAKFNSHWLDMLKKDYDIVRAYKNLLISEGNFDYLNAYFNMRKELGDLDIEQV